MSTATDRILALLDNATQQSPEADPWGSDPDACWRCEASAAEAQGLCGSCRSVLLDEAYAAPEPDDIIRWADGSPFVEYPESGWRITTPDPPTVQQIAQANARFLEALDGMRAAMEVLTVQVTAAWEAIHRE